MDGSQYLRLIVKIPESGHDRIGSSFDKRVYQIGGIGSPTGPTPVSQAESVTSLARMWRSRISGAWSSRSSKNNTEREEKKIVVPSRGKIMPFAGKMRGNEFGRCPLSCH